MKIKHIIISIAILASAFGMVSCDDFLQVPDKSIFTIDSVFAKKINADKYMYSLYQDAPKILQNWGGSGDIAGYILAGASRTSITDEAGSLALQPAYNSHLVNAGNVNSTWFTTNQGEDDYARHWKTIRKCYIMLENIDNVPDMTTELKDRYKGEAKILVALEYFEMWKRYGGLPIITKTYTDADYPKTSRSTLKETYDFIISLCDEVIANPNLPAKTTLPLEFGRATKALAYGLKARTMLYAASPLFNSVTPYIDFGANNDLICFGNYDSNRWKAARDAALEAITYCEANGYAIVNDATKRTTGRNYIVATCKRPNEGNTEVMFGTTWATDQANIAVAWMARGRMGGSAVNTPTHNSVEFFTNVDGTSVNWNASMNADGTAGTAMLTPANQPEFYYKNLDPRFQQSIVYNGCKWSLTPDVIIQFYDGATTAVTDGLEGPKKAKSEFMYGFRKYLNDFEKSRAGFQPMNPVVRLAEMYMIYAEASNEFESAPTAAAFDKIDVIRTRSGMPVVNRALDKSQFKEYIRAERAREFFAEDHRYFDLRRWKTPQPFLKIYNMKIVKNADNTYSYQKYLHQNRYWADFWYLHPFPYAEVYKGYGLIQNPGW